jgi:hypothetical protein
VRNVKGSIAASIICIAKCLLIEQRLQRASALSCLRHACNISARHSKTSIDHKPRAEWGKLDARRKTVPLGERLAQLRARLRSFSQFGCFNNSSSRHRASELSPTVVIRN